jgi:RNA-directed DNA polymerase
MHWRDRPEWIFRSDAEIIHAYNAQLRGFANYYSLANNAKRGMRKLNYIWRGSLLKTLAAKHKTTVGKVVRRLQRGSDLIYTYQINNKTRQLKVFALKDVKPGPKSWEVDRVAQTAVFTYSRTELLRRLQADRCEYCGTEKGYSEVHHVRKLRDLQGKERWEQVMSAMRRKTLVLCIACHHLLHQGALPAWRNRGVMKRRAGFTET